MSDDREQKLTAFLAGQLALTGHRSCVKIELEYSPATGFRPDPVKTWTPESHPEIFGVFAPENDGDEPEPEETRAGRRHLFVQKLVGEMIELAEDFADSYGSGAHRFVVRTHEHLHARATFRFKVLPGYHGDEQSLEAQPPDPTAAGIVKQLMGHLENKERGMRDMLGQFLGAMKHSIETLRGENEALRGQLDAVAAKRAAEVEQIEAAKSKEHDRELELMIVMGERERKDFMAKKFGGLLPAVTSIAMRKLGGGKGEGAGVNGKKSKPSPLAQTLLKVGITLTDDQKSQIQSVLAIEQLIVLEEIMEAAKEGGNIVLPALVNDFVNTLKAAQIRALFGIFTDEQRPLFVQAMQIAKAQAASAEAADGEGASGSGSATEAVDAAEQGAS